ncbi:protein seele [Euwallacea similis]|uniref:protein seele n=1 Tax=Euwallacea similis TaxID=1736056 RepID=UPI00344B14FE
MLYKTLLLSFLVLLCHVLAQDVVHDVKLDNKEVRCLVCEASIQELTEAVKSVDRSQTVKVGGHRLDPHGNYDAPKSVSAAHSEIFLSELMEGICKKMDDYVRGLWKTNGTLTILKMVYADGKMNPYMGEIEFVQDDDLNKSLKYYCETIIEEFEENIIKYYQNDADNIETKFCIDESHICPPKKPLPEKEL